MRTIKRYFAVYTPLLLSLISWLIFIWAWSSMFYEGYEKGFNAGIDATLNRINELSFDNGVKYSVSEE